MQRSFRAARKSDTTHCPVNLSNHRLKPAGERIMHWSLSENQALAFLSYKIWLARYELARVLYLQLLRIMCTTKLLLMQVSQDTFQKRSTTADTMQSLLLPTPGPSSPSVSASPKMETLDQNNRCNFNCSLKMISSE